MGGFEDAVRRGAAGVDDALGPALVIEVGDLLPEVEVLQRVGPRWPAFSEWSVSGRRRPCAVVRNSPASSWAALAELAAAEGPPMFFLPLWRDEAIFSPVAEGQAMASPTTDNTGGRPPQSFGPGLDRSRLRLLPPSQGEMVRRIRPGDRSLLGGAEA